MTVRRPFDKLRVPSTVEPSAPLRLDPERGRVVEGRNRGAASRERRVEPCSREAYFVKREAQDGTSECLSFVCEIRFTRYERRRSQQRIGDCSRSARESCGL